MSLFTQIPFHHLSSSSSLDHHSPYLHCLTPLYSSFSSLSSPRKSELCTNSTLRPRSWKWLERRPYRAAWSHSKFMTAILMWVLGAARQSHLMSLVCSLHHSSRWLFHCLSSSVSPSNLFPYLFLVSVDGLAFYLTKNHIIYSHHQIHQPSSTCIHMP